MIKRKRNFKNYKEYKEYFKKLINLERKAQMEQHLKEIRTISGKERERRGRALLNMKAKYEGIGIGGFHIVRYSREREIRNTEISVGDIVLISLGKPTGREVQGTVYEIGKHYIKVAFSEKPPKYALSKNVRIDLFSNEITFKRMEKALEDLKNHPLLKLVLGTQ